MIILVNKILNIDDKVKFYARNGATRRILKLIIEDDVEIINDNNKGQSVIKNAEILVMNDKYESIIKVINSGKYENKYIGIFLNSEYGYDVITEKSPDDCEIFSASSVGGYGNSQSKFGIYKVGTILKVHTYKFRTPATYYRLTESGWIEISNETLFPEKFVKIEV